MSLHRLTHLHRDIVFIHFIHLKSTQGGVHWCSWFLALKCTEYNPFLTHHFCVLTVHFYLFTLSVLLLWQMDQWFLFLWHSADCQSAHYNLTPCGCTHAQIHRLPFSWVHSLPQLYQMSFNNMEYFYERKICVCL